MHNHPPCEQAGGPNCGHSCPALQTGPIRLSEAAARFEREAVRGVCDTGRYRMPYFVWGSGPPLVCIHGVSDTSQSFLLPLSRLSARFRCIGYDLPSGHGDGARLSRYRHEHLADDLWALLDHLGLQRAYLLASSFGSTVALQAMHARPERIPRAILQGGLAHRPLRRAEAVVAWLLRFFPGPVTRLPKRLKILEHVHKTSFTEQAEERWNAFVEWTGKARLAALGHQIRWLGGVDLREELRQIRQPVLLVTGDRDTTVPRRHADLLMDHLPSAGLVVIEGCGHVPCYTHPEALADLVRQFLTPPGEECPGAKQAACGAERQPLL